MSARRHNRRPGPSGSPILAERGPTQRRPGGSYQISLRAPPGYVAVHPYCGGPSLEGTNKGTTEGQASTRRAPPRRLGDGWEIGPSRHKGERRSGGPTC
ncbi:hypothetical protein NDU88_001643 [Pleurodeles waltl]|uniref:Uncharacterized protein n=1 Tax=Pleurodeles waltl TaxID=8319 RepID=A0AAV7LZW4_PLEWA|nr:hypothetical protein NDU88_001643 [Pleurodeles waltl]